MSEWNLVVEDSLVRSPFQGDAGAELLDRLLAFVTRFVSLSQKQACVVALWVALTHCFDAFDCTPYLSVNSAEKQSGKTRLLEVLELLTANSWLTGRVSSAVLMRKIEAERPTLLLDESDTAFGSDKEYAEALRGALNTGYRRSGSVSCCVKQGAKITFKDFSTFCPKAIAGIGKLPDTVADRSIPIRLKRAIRGKVERFRRRDVDPEASALAGKLAAWCEENKEILGLARPEIPQQLSDRQADVCEPLLAIADLIGGDWPKEGRAALMELCAKAYAEDDSTGVRLLTDISGIFAEKKVDILPSEALASALAEIEGSPWGEWSKGKPLSTNKLARLLKAFEVFPDRIGPRDSRVRGYTLSHFQDAFTRYIPPESVHTSTSRENSGDDGVSRPSTEAFVDRSNNTISPAQNAGCGHVDTLEPGTEGREAGQQRAFWGVAPVHSPSQEKREVEWEA